MKRVLIQLTSFFLLFTSFTCNLILRKKIGHCPASGYICKSDTVYLLCFEINDVVFQLGEEQSCPDKVKCSELDEKPCVFNLPEYTNRPQHHTSTIPPQIPVSTEPPVEVVPICSGVHQLHAGSKCNEYYICTYHLFWLKPDLMKCPSGFAFDGSNCAASTVCHQT